ncbi:MAG: carbohydrate binding domain-containing protein [Chloroflexota bacterium]
MLCAYYRRFFRSAVLTALVVVLLNLIGLQPPGFGGDTFTQSAYAAPPWNGVPHVTVDYTRDVEAWWHDHPFNPESPNYAPNISSPANQVNVRTQHGGNIQAAIDALPASGGTLFLPAGNYSGNFRLVARSNVHFRGEAGTVISVTGNEGNRIAGCELANNYSMFGAYVQARVPEALTCATDGRIRNLYFKDLVFDGGGSAIEAFDMSAAMDIVFDGVTFQNFRDPGAGHPGIISGNAVLDNIWIRNSRFVGREQYAVYFDGLHGGGVINSVIENGFSRSALLFLTNDDYSRDYDGDGTIRLPEQRMSQHVVVYGNTFAGGTYDLVSATGRQILVMANTISTPVVTVAYFQAKSSAVDASVTYEFTGNRIVRNYLRTVHQFIEMTGPPQCPKVTNCAKIGQYQIRDNVVESAANYVQPATLRPSSYGQIIGPHVVSGNCIADPTCRNIVDGGATRTPTPVSGGGGSSISQRFPLGLFEDANILEGLDARFEPLITNAQSKGLDSVMFNNNNVDRDEPMLSVSDRRNFNVYFAPQHEMNAQWFYSSAPTTIEAARSLAYPIVDRVKAHPSLRGYNLVDEPGLEHRDKFALMVQAFRERDAARPATGILIGINRAEPLFAAAQPGVFLADVYPMGAPNAPCDYTMTGFGYQQEDFSSYIRRLTAQKPAGTPLWLILQTHRYSQGSTYALRVPTVPEVRAQQWMAVGEGATGIFWFAYSSDGDRTGLKDSPALFNEVGALANRLGPLRSTLVDTRRVNDAFTVSGPNNPYVSTLATADGQRKFAVVVNKGTCSGSANLTVNAPGLSGQLRDLESGAVYALGTPITFGSGDGKVFELVNGSGSAPTPAATATRTPTAPPAATLTRTPTSPPAATATRAPTSAPSAPTPVPSGPSDGNLVRNSSFDTLTGEYPADWRQRPTSSYDAGISHTGRGSLRLSGPTSSTYADQGIRLKPSTTYVLRFWARTVGVSGNGVAIRYAQTAPGAQTLIQSGYTKGSEEWREQVYTFTTPSNYSNGRLDVQWAMSGGTAWIDDISLEELNAPTSPSANLVVNGTFDQEAGGFPAGWRPRPSAVWTSNVVRSGAGSFEARGPSSDTYSDQSIKLKPNTTYTLSYWVRTMNAGGEGISVRYSQISPRVLTLMVTPSTSGSRAWTQVTARFTTPANYTSGRLDIRWNLTGGYAWIDDMVLFEE